MRSRMTPISFDLFLVVSSSTLFGSFELAARGSSWYSKIPTLSNRSRSTNVLSISKSSSHSPGNPTIKLVRMKEWENFVRILESISSI